MSAGDESVTTAGEAPLPTETGEETSAEATESTKYRLSLDVTIDDVGPCKKHVRVRVPKDDIHHHYQEAVAEMVGAAEVPGFRVGHVPERLVQRRYRKELYGQVKQQVLIDSLEQLAEDHQLDPINEPDFDVDTLELRGDMDFEYEFEVEVRPAFELPDYAGLTIQRPVWEITDELVEHALQQFLEQYGELVEKDVPAESDDHVNVGVHFSFRGQPLRQFKSLTLRLRPVLRFQDAELDGFDQLMIGVRPGDVREADLTVSLEAEELEMRGETVHAKFDVKAVKTLRLPELSTEFFQRIGADSEDDLRDQVRRMLERQLAYAQRQSAREQVLEKITDSANWDLPEDLVMRQVENALRREIIEMQQAGFTTREIQSRENELRQRAVSITRQALKQHFVLDKIGQEEEIKVEPGDIETEILMMALQRGENPRRVRARLQKTGMIENLEAQIYERKAIDVVLSRAQYEDVPSTPPVESDAEAVPQAVCAQSSVTTTLDSGED